MTDRPVSLAARRALRSITPADERAAADAMYDRLAQPEVEQRIASHLDPRAGLRE